MGDNINIREISGMLGESIAEKLIAQVKSVKNEDWQQLLKPEVLAIFAQIITSLFNSIFSIFKAQESVSFPQFMKNLTEISNPELIRTIVDRAIDKLIKASENQSEFVSDSLEAALNRFAENIEVQVTMRIVPKIGDGNGNGPTAAN